MRRCRSSSPVFLGSILILSLLGDVFAFSQETIPPTPATASASTAELAAGALERGPWKVATLRERDGIRNGPEYRGGTIHYPVGASTSLPIMVICPGFQASEGSVRPWGGFLASHGIVTMTIGTNRPDVMPIARGRALLDGIETVRAEQDREGSPLKGRIDGERAGVAGWSMGGGGAQHAAMLDPTLKGVVAMVPWQPLIRFEHPVPVLILAGDKDEIASTRKHARPHFDSTPKTTPRLLYEVRGGGHFLPSSPENHRAQVGAITLAWVKTFVEGDDRYLEVLEERPSTASIYELELPGVMDQKSDASEPAGVSTGSGTGR